MLPGPEDFTRNVLKMNDETTTTSAMRRVLMEAIEKWEMYKKNVDRPTKAARFIQAGSHYESY